MGDLDVGEDIGRQPRLELFYPRKKGGVVGRVVKARKPDILVDRDHQALAVSAGLEKVQAVDRRTANDLFHQRGIQGVELAIVDVEELAQQKGNGLAFVGIRI